MLGRHKPATLRSEELRVPSPCCQLQLAAGRLPIDFTDGRSRHKVLKKSKLLSLVMCL